MRILLVTLLFLSACTPRGTITLDPNAGQVGQVRSFLVGTTRGFTDDGRPNVERHEGLELSRMDISIPPTHQAGQIAWPGRYPDPEKHMLTQTIERYDPAEFRAELKRELRARPRSERSVMLFVHGYNTTFAEGMYRFAQVVHDTNMPEIAVHYSWPSAGNPLGYGYDRDSMLFARDGLEQLITEIASTGAEVVLIGHSMGSLLIMETLRQTSIRDRHFVDRSISGVVLISPDIDIDLFRQQALRIGPLPEPFVIFSSSKDKLLRLSAAITGRRDRLGNIDDIRELSDLDVIVVDVSAFTDAETSHNTALSSPTFLRLINSMGEIDAAFGDDPNSSIGVLPGTVLMVQGVTEIILAPF